MYNKASKCQFAAKLAELIINKVIHEKSCMQRVLGNVTDDVTRESIISCIKSQYQYLSIEAVHVPVTVSWINLLTYIMYLSSDRK
jgi:hypothetical protein